MKLRPLVLVGSLACCLAWRASPAADLLAVYCLGEVDVRQTKIASISDLAADGSPLTYVTEIPLITPLPQDTGIGTAAPTAPMSAITNTTGS